MDKHQNGYVLSGNLLTISHTEPKGYNWFKVFISDISEVLEHFNVNKLKKRQVLKLKNSLVKSHLLGVYIYSRLKLYENDIFNQTTTNEINKLIFNNYSSTFNFWIYLFPFFIMPDFLLKLIYEIYKSYNKRT